jgi:hypothetical protein
VLILPVEQVLEAEGYVAGIVLYVVIKNLVVVLRPWLIFEHCNSDMVHAMRLNIHTDISMKFTGINSGYCQTNGRHGELQTMITVTVGCQQLETYVMTKETAHFYPGIFLK